MKKSLVILVALCFVLSIGATALAAPANPFVDVPAKHWAYDAVSKLAKAGIVDGYGDGTFRGDKTMTRYEMAQIVAKAMAKSDKASAEMKALVDKLAVEFAAELNNLGVRVAALEKNSATPFGPSVKVYGDARTRYQKNGAIAGVYGVTATQPNGSVIQPAAGFQERFRLNFDMSITDSSFMQSRLTYQNKTSVGQANGDTTYGGVLGSQALNLDYGFFQFKNVLSGVDFRIGRDNIGTGYGLIAGNTGGYDSFRFLFNAGDQVKGWVAYGDNNYIAANGVSNSALKSTNTNPGLVVNAYGLATSPAVNVTTTNWVWNPDKNFQMAAAGYWSNTKDYHYKVLSVGAKGNLTPGLYLAGEYAHNGDSGATILGGVVAAGGAPVLTVNSSVSQKTAYYFQLGYHHGDNNTNNGIDYANPGAWGLFLNYKHWGGQAVDWNNTSILVFEALNDPFMYSEGNKGFGYGIQYVPVKWVRITGTYEQMKSLDGSVKRPAFTYVRAEYCF
jgi:hypothetical protein